MKKLITISLFIFWAACTAVLAAGLVYYQINKNPGGLAKNIFTSSQNGGNQGTGLELLGGQDSSSTVMGSSQVIALSLAEIAKHNTANDCWLLINNNVYNVTSYIASHPGGSGTIISNCGKDSTQGYNTKGGNTPHSANANSLLADYYIGSLNKSVDNFAVLASGANPSKNNLSADAKASPATNSTQTNNPVSSQVSVSNLSLSMVEISKHSTPGDCWLLINNKVYNVTSYIASHPGGSRTITSNCGKDSTQAYNTKGSNKPHSSGANSLLADYYIGDLNQQITQQQIRQNIQTTNTITPPKGGEENEWEDD